MTAGRPPAQFEATLARLRTELNENRVGTDLLPGERDLSAQFGVSRTTMRRVLSALVAEGRLTHRHGVGTFIVHDAGPTAPPPAAPRALTGFSEAMRRRGHVPSSQELGRAVVDPSPEQAMLLGCLPRDRALRLRRLRLADGEPVMVEENVMPVAYGRDPAEGGGSLYTALARAGVSPIRALQRVQAGQVGPADGEPLGLPAGAPVILLTRTDYLADGRCCCVTQATVRADRFDLLLELGPDSEAGSGPFTAP